METVFDSFSTSIFNLFKSSKFLEHVIISKLILANFKTIYLAIHFDPPEITSNLFFINLNYDNNLRNCNKHC